MGNFILTQYSSLIHCFHRYKKTDLTTFSCRRLVMNQNIKKATMQILEDGNTANELSDGALLSAIAGGALRAMDSLYERYHRILYSLAYRMVADHQIAEDLLQDAFLSVWKRSTSFSPQAGAARSWLISILHH